MNIAKSGSRSGLSAKTIRYYEDIGLLPEPQRSGSGYRQYSDSDVALQRFVRRARAFGFSVAECRSLLELYRDPRRASAKVRELTLSKIAEIDAKLAELKEIRGELMRLTEACRGDEQPDCPILDELAEAPK